MSFKVFQDRLRSGLRVVTVQTPRLHSVMCAVYVRVGSRHETRETSGVSHLLEHLFFRGSRRYPDSVRMNAAVEAVGGNLNGVTMRDSSYFYTPAHADGLEVSLDILGDMLTRPKLTKLATEKRVILEEMLDEVDERGRDVDVENLSKQELFGAHPLALKIAGTVEGVKRLTASQVRAHFERAYVAGNMVVAVAGPVTRARVLKAARRAFRYARPGPQLTEQPPPPFRTNGPYLRFVPLDESQVEFRLSFPAVPESHPDAPALALLRRVLDDGLSSRLPHRIVEQLGLAYSVGATIEGFHDTALFEVDGACAPCNLARVLTEVLRTLATLRRGETTSAELRRAKTRFALHLDFQQDSPAELCGWFGGAELFRPAQTFATKKAEVAAVTLRELTRVARTYLCAERLVTVAVGPRSAKRPAQQVLTQAARLLG